MKTLVAAFLGFGYTASFMTPHLQDQGLRLVGTTQKPEKLESISKQGVEAHLWQAPAPPGVELTQALEGADYWIISAPPAPAGGDGLLQAIESSGVAPPAQGRLVYFSATSVYGHHDGAWVDEATPLNPTSAQGKERVVAEAGWTAFAKKHRVPLTIFRLSGIYGPGRTVMDRLSQGVVLYLIAGHQNYISRIHVEDLAKLSSACLLRPQEPPVEIYNLADDCPAPYNDALKFAYGLVGQSVPSPRALDAPCFSDPFRRFMADNKRVVGHKIQKITGLKLTYPSYVEGFRSLALKNTP